MKKVNNFNFLNMQDSSAGLETLQTKVNPYGIMRVDQIENAIKANPYLRVAGLSLSLVIRDIARGTLSVDKVPFIIAGTRCSSPEEWNNLLRDYERLYWEENPEATRIAQEFFNKGLIIQPRLLTDPPGDDGHSIADGTYLPLDDAENVERWIRDSYSYLESQKLNQLVQDVKEAMSRAVDSGSNSTGS